MIELRVISKAQAQSFYAEYEHLGNCGLGVWHFGLFDGDMLLSVVSFGTVNFNTNRSSLGNIAKKYSISVLQLTRGGTRYDAPKNTPTHIIKLALQKMRLMFGDAIIVAYSDTKWNEVGTIYQASNFIYIGQTEPKGQSDYIISGRKISGWTVRKRYGTRNYKELQRLEPEIVRIPLNKKHKYIFINASSKVKKKIMNVLSDIIRPYPKRDDEGIESMRIVHKKLGLYAESSQVSDSMIITD